MTARYMPGALVPDHPNGWTLRARELICLACRRAEAAEAAKAEGATAKDVRRALAAFEWRRDPFAQVASVAKASGAPRWVANEVRGRLRATGEIPSQPPRTPPKRRAPKPSARRREPKPRQRKRYAAAYPGVAAELRADPRRTNPVIADAAELAGPSLAARRSVVKRTRRELEMLGEIEVYPARGGKPRNREAGG